MIHVGPVKMRIEGEFVGRTGKTGKLFGYVAAKSIDSLSEPEKLSKYNIKISLSVHEGRAEYFTGLGVGDIIEVWGIIEQQHGRGAMVSKTGKRVNRPGFLYIWPQTIRVVSSKKIEPENTYTDNEVPI